MRKAKYITLTITTNVFELCKIALSLKEGHILNK